MPTESLFQTADQFLRDGYTELAQYVYVLPELIKAGFTQFTRDLSMTREWADRVLSLMEQARRLRPLVEEASTTAKRKLDYAVVSLLADSKTTVPKKLDAGQRYLWARAQFSDLERQAQDWARLHDEVRAFIDSSNDRFKHLLNAKNDLRSQLWAVRLHGLLGELHQEGRTLEDELRPPFRPSNAADTGTQTDLVVPVPMPRREQEPLTELTLTQPQTQTPPQRNR